MAVKRLEIGVSADRSLSTVYEPLIAASARAKAALKKDADAEAAALEAASKKAATAAAKAFAQIEAMSAKEAAAEIASADKAAQAKVKASQKAFDAELKAFEKRMALAKKVADAEEREIMRSVAATEKAEARKLAAAEKVEQKDREKAGARAVGVGREALGTFAGVGRKAIGIASDVASGAGVNLDLSSYVGKAVSAETKATNIVNQASMSGQDMGDGAAKGLVDHARSVANAAKVDTNATLDVLAAFQAKSSDLKTGEDVLERLAKLAKVSGTEFADMGTAAGAVNAQLEDTPDRAERLVAIMAHLTKQTADGSVEMSDYSKYVGVIAASANSYSGSFDKNIGQLGALSQMAMKGGAYTAAMATGAAASFAKDLTKDKTLKKWTGAGVDVFADEGHTKLKDVEELIVAYTKVKGADRAELAKFFPNVVSKRAVESSLDTYQKAGGGAAGEAAIREEFAKFRATLSDDKIAAMYKTQEGTTANKVVDFNNQLEKIAASLAERVLPAMEKMGPKILEVVDAMGRIVGWAAENPKSAIAAALVGSIAKAGIGDILSKGVESLMSKAGAGSLTIAVAAATFMLGKTAIDEITGKKDAAVTASVEDEARRGNLLGKASYEARHGGVTAETRAEMEKMEAELQARIKGAEAPTSTLGALFSTDKTLKGAATEQADAMKIGDLKADLARLIAVTEANKPPKVVSVDNLPPGASPTAGAGTSNTGAPAVGGRR